MTDDYSTTDHVAWTRVTPPNKKRKKLSLSTELVEDYISEDGMERDDVKIDVQDEESNTPIGEGYVSHDPRSPPPSPTIGPDLCPETVGVITDTYNRRMLLRQGAKWMFNGACLGLWFVLTKHFVENLSVVLC
jgi:hypothetical protein